MEIIIEILLYIFIIVIIFGPPTSIIAYFVYEYFYFRGEKFLKIKKSIKEYINECNDLNDHIEELKKAYIDFKRNDYGIAQYIDNSSYNYKRPKLNQISNSNNILNCSATICKNAQQQPFKYLCKYFNIQSDEETLEKFEKILNDFSAAEQGKVLLKNKREEILASIINKIPFLIRTFGKNKLIRELGFKNIDFSQLYFPKYTFKYVSAGGNSSIECNIVFDIDTLDRFINYLAENIKFRKSVAGQRALMTSSLRQKIKERDNYTCKNCGVSIEQEPNLLLEIDHIFPLSKGGKTEEENLQTLCWKCNRKKGNKIERGDIL